jgi:tetratricopeptide (TPR) repeat protein
VTQTQENPAFFASIRVLRLAWLCAALLVVAALALNLKVIDFGFLYLRDDDVNVALNPNMGGLGADRIAWMFTDAVYARRYIPLGWLNFAATYQFAGLDPRPYHTVALVLFLTNAGLVFAILLEVLRCFAPAARMGGLTAWEAGAAALAAAGWVFHPFRVETTAWVSGNLYGQAMALLFVSLLAYLGTYRSRGRRRLALLVASALAFTASLLTYPLALGVPVLLVGMDYLRSRAEPGNSFRRLLVEKIAFGAPLAAVLALTLAARFGNTEAFGAVPGIRDLPLLDRVAQSAYVAAYYLWKPWWPTDLSPLYDQLVDFNPLGAPLLLSMAVVGAITVAAIAAFRKRPAVAVLWFGYLACAAPFFGLTEKNHMTSDRYAFFLTVIVAAAVAVLIARVEGRRARVIVALGSLAVVAVFGLMSHRQLQIWTDDRVQHAYVARHLKDPGLLDDFTSRLLILEFMRGNEEAASEEVALRLAQNPRSAPMQKAARIISDKRRISSYYGRASYLAIVHDQMGLNFARSGQFREANDHFEEALRMDDRFYQAAYDRALVLLRLGRADDALHSYLLSLRWASPPLAGFQRRVFLDRLTTLADGLGRKDLAQAARGPIAR